MKKNKSLINLFTIKLAVMAIILISCSKQAEKPKLTLSEYSTQGITSRGVVNKILNEADYKKMHEIALAVESSRAINCISISEECNVLGEILNHIVKATNEGLPKEADNVAIYKLLNQMNEEFRVGHEKLGTQWELYLKSEKDSK